MGAKSINISLSQVDLGPKEVKSYLIDEDFTWTPLPVFISTASYEWESLELLVLIALKKTQYKASDTTSGTFKVRPPKLFKSKFNSYNKDKHISLDELMESPTFDENIFLKNKTIYKKVKTSIDRDKAAQIPGMEELWKEIEKMDRILKENTGELEKTKDTPTLDKKQIYYLKH